MKSQEESTAYQMQVTTLNFNAFEVINQISDTVVVNY